jgi:hypothetical protein
MSKVGVGASRNLRSVWHLATQPYPEAHFATFPGELPERCIKAGTSEKGVCAACGAPYERVVEKNNPDHSGTTKSQYPKETTANRLALLRQAAREQGQEFSNDTKTTGWRPTCDCAAPVIPATVLDPFAGSGTTNAKAEDLGRRSIAIETKAEYCALILKRCHQQQII